MSLQLLYRCIFIIIALQVFYNTQAAENTQSVIDSLKKEWRNASEDLQKVEILNDLVKAYYNINLDSAYFYGRKALEIPHKDYPELYYNTVNRLSSACALKGKHTEHLEYALIAFNLAQQLNDPKKIGRTYNALGVAYIHLEQPDSALRHLLSAQHIAKQHKLMTLLIYSSTNLGIVYDKLNDYKSSLSYYRKSIHIMDSLDKKHGFSTLYNNMANIKIRQKKYSEAIDLLRQGLDYYVEGKSDVLSPIYLENTLARAFYLSNQPDSAIRHARISLLLNAQINNLTSLANSYKHLMMAWSAKNQTDSMLYYESSYIDLEDSLEVNKIAQKIADLQVEFDMALKENKIKQLETEQKVKNFWLYASAGGLMGLLIFSVLIFRQYKQKNTAYQSLVKKNQELMKLHDFTRKERLKAIHQPEYAKTETSEEEKALTTKYISSGLSEELENALRSEIIKKIELDKVYLDHEINIDKLASELNTNKTYLSQIINKEFGHNFSNFINDYRIKEAISLMAQPDYHDVRMESIAFEVGFNSISSFNRAFKKFTGLSPSYYRDSLSKN